MINPSEGNLPKQACMVYRKYRIFNNIRSRALSTTVQLQHHYLFLNKNMVYVSGKHLQLQ